MSRSSHAAPRTLSAAALAALLLLAVVLVALLLFSLVGPGGVGIARAAERAVPPPPPPADTGGLPVPQSVIAEHQEIHAELVHATKVPGRVGTAARELGRVLYPHLVREEQIALPPLALLAPLASGADVTPPTRALLAASDTLRAELPRMLAQHADIRVAATRLGAAAIAARDTRVMALVEKLERHARGEEELLYPSAILAGEVLRARTAATGACPMAPAHP